MKIIERNKPRVDNLAIIELQSGQSVYSQRKEEHPVYSSLPDAADLAYQFQRPISHKPNLFR